MCNRFRRDREEEQNAAGGHTSKPTPTGWCVCSGPGCHCIYFRGTGNLCEACGHEYRIH